ncbi:hypothetical protein C9374_007728 [Naegleria lovaniensis]|uniref:Uncharacterized protein n=1 Tax=Naegleria lovaniensis TaxID=51637 RepID=A0AA88KH09_NAELO|nr:uncharacterized protein C9374_007728 [Naegleria lovaniensis]KAG2379090.1 hypothetical protein C9374_007728 [Naegleria lovaniensis]
MKRNQHILFLLLFMVEGLVCFNMLTRIASEIAYLHPNPSEGFVASVVIKIFDRCFVNLTVYMEVVLMSHICYSFSETCRAISAFTSTTFSNIRKFVIALLGVLGVLFFLLCAFTVIFGGFTAGHAAIEESTLSYLNLALFLSAAALFLVSTISVSVFLNVSILKCKEKSKEKIKTYQIKKTALRKSLAIQYGLTACMIFQFFGFIFIPASLGWTYLMNFFHFCYNIGLVGFIVLILCIYNPMRQVQKLFRQDSDPKVVHMSSTNGTLSSGTMNGSKHTSKTFTSNNNGKMMELSNMVNNNNMLETSSPQLYMSTNDTRSSVSSSTTFNSSIQKDLEMMNTTMISSPTETTCSVALTSPATTIIIVNSNNNNNGGDHQV